MLNEMGKRAKAAAEHLRLLDTRTRNGMLHGLAEALLKNQEEILAANAKDLAFGEAQGLSPALMDRLLLDAARVAGMAKGLGEVAALPDPLGETLDMRTLENGLQVGRKRVPLGVVGIIYESRPNVTVDTAALCLKSGNALILRGGKEAIHSNKALVAVIQDTLEALGHPRGLVQLIEDLSYETAGRFMKLHAYLDVLIPRGSARLIQSVVENATVPVIETGVGNCHIYVDEGADLAMALPILVNAKVQRPGVCNAMESLVLHESHLEGFLPVLKAEMDRHGVEIRADEAARKVLPDLVPATEADYGTEFLSLIFSLKTVAGFEEALEHIKRYSTGHSEAILTQSYQRAMAFTEAIDAAAVYVNASTRFTDGGALGLGAEMGISTQKLHARGPVGLKELTTTKYVIFGSGQVRS